MEKIPATVVVTIVALFLMTSCDTSKEIIPDDSSDENGTDISLAQSEQNDRHPKIESKTVIDEIDKTQLTVTVIPSPVGYTPTPVPQTKLNTDSGPTPTEPPQPTPTFTVTPSPTPVQLDESYDNDTYGISIGYPSGWVIEETYEPGESWTIKILSSASESYVEIIGQHAPNVTLKQFVSARIGLDEQYVERNRVPIEDMPGYFSEGKHVFTKNSMKIVMFVKDEWAIHAAFVVGGPQDEPTLDLMRDSFKLKIP
ncbi:MAG: hypothetical protein VX701_01940 [Chloroflexota bacterium]|nr:hypothetical protein [Chloroflexota bacterium]